MGTAPKVSLLSIPAISIKVEEEDEDEELSGTVTPPFNASAAVPFLWEEEPGKPRASTALITTTSCPTLELPPRMFMSHKEEESRKQASPTTVLEGPYVKKRPKASSFRMTLKESSSIMMSPCPTGEGGTLLVSKRWLSKDKAWFWTSKRRKLGKIISEDYVVSPCDSLYFDCDDQWDNTTSSVKKNIKGAHFWASIYGGLKHAISWKPKKLKDHNTLQ